MAGSLNKVMLIGNLGKDPELKTFEGGNMLARFPLATSETYTNKSNEKVEQTEWHNVSLWGGLAEVADKYLKKGDKVFIEGRIKTRSWDDPKGEKKYFTEIHGDNMTMLGSPRDAGQEGRAQEPAAKNQPAPADLSKDGDEDDLPF